MLPTQEIEKMYKNWIKVKYFDFLSDTEFNQILDKYGLEFIFDFIVDDEYQKLKNKKIKKD